MQKFIKGGIEYMNKQELQNGNQYAARYQDGTEAWAFIPGKKHTRKQVIEAVAEVNKSLKCE